MEIGSSSVYEQMSGVLLTTKFIMDNRGYLAQKWTRQLREI